MSDKNIPVWLHQVGQPKIQIGLASEPKDGVSSMSLYPEYKGKGIKDFTIGDAPAPQHILDANEKLHAKVETPVEETAEYTPDATFEAPESEEASVIPEIPVTEIVLESAEEFAEHTEAPAEEVEVSNGDPANDNNTDAEPAEGALATPKPSFPTRREARQDTEKAPVTTTLGGKFDLNGEKDPSYGVSASSDAATSQDPTKLFGKDDGIRSRTLPQPKTGDLRS